MLEVGIKPPAGKDWSGNIKHSLRKVSDYLRLLNNAFSISALKHYAPFLKIKVTYAYLYSLDVNNAGSWMRISCYREGNYNVQGMSGMYLTLQGLQY
jgi:hypothetical protein